jgi:Flp pilus assembly protein TadD
VLALGVAAVLVRISWVQADTWSSSERLWTHALQHNGPAIPEIQNHLAVTLVETNQSGRAEQHLREAVRLNPRSADALHNLGALLANQGRVADADVLFVDALGLNPNHADAHMNHGTVLVKQGRTIEGLRSYIRALELDPETEVPSRLRSLLLGRYNLDRDLAALIWPLVDNPADRAALEALKRAVDLR